jgi:hypothetical protein
MFRARVGTASSIAILALAGFGSAAHASCAIPIAGFASGSDDFGANAVTAIGCSLQAKDGGSGATTASVLLTSNGMSASANLASGVLTAYSAGGFASAAEWDTFTFTGVPAGGESITATLSLDGTLTGGGTGTADIQAGPSATFGVIGTVVQSTFFGNSFPIPPSIEVEVTVTDASSITVLSAIQADGFPGNVTDLADPPTLTLDLPAGVTATSASGVFTNFQPLTAAPEPSTVALLLTGLGVLVQARRRHARSASRMA